MNRFLELIGWRRGPGAVHLLKAPVRLQLLFVVCLVIAWFVIGKLVALL